MSMETGTKESTGHPARPIRTNEETSSRAENPTQDSAGDDSMNAAFKSTASRASFQIDPPKPTQTNNEMSPAKDTPNPTNVETAPASDGDTAIKYNILDEPEVYDDDESPAFTFACTQNPLLRYFHKRSPEWWAEYRKQLQEAKNAPLPSGSDAEL